MVKCGVWCLESDKGSVISFFTPDFSAIVMALSQVCVDFLFSSGINRQIPDIFLESSAHLLYGSEEKYSRSHSHPHLDPLC